MLYTATHLNQVLENVFTRALLHLDVHCTDRYQEVPRGRGKGRGLSNRCHPQYIFMAFTYMVDVYQGKCLGAMSAHQNTLAVSEHTHTQRHTLKH